MRSDKDVIKPGKNMYFLPVGILVATIVIFVIFLIGGIKDAVTGTRFLVPGSMEFEAQEGTYVIYYEYESVLDGTRYSTGNIDLSSLDLLVFDMDNKVELQVVAPKTKSNYNINNRKGYGVLQFEVDKPGRLVIDGRYRQNQDEPIVLNIGQSMVPGILKLVFGSFLILFGGIGLAMILIFVISMKRSKAIRKYKEEEREEAERKRKGSMPKLWRDYLESRGLSDQTPYESWAFGSNSRTANELLKLVLAGKKTATASVYKLYELENEPLPSPGDYSVILDGYRRDRCIIRTDHVKIAPFNEVDEDHAAKEGEGDGSLAYWRKVHQEAFSKELAGEGIEFSETLLIVLEEFSLVYKE